MFEPKVQRDRVQGVFRYANQGVTRPEVINPSGMFAQTLGTYANAATGLGNLYAGLQRLGLDKQKQQEEMMSSLQTVRDNTSPEKFATMREALKNRFDITDEEFDYYLNMERPSDRKWRNLDALMGDRMGAPVTDGAEETSPDTRGEMTTVPAEAEVGVEEPPPPATPVDPFDPKYQGLSQEENIGPTREQAGIEVGEDEEPPQATLRYDPAADPIIQQLDNAPGSAEAWNQHRAQIVDRSRTTERPLSPQAEQERQMSMGEASRMLTEMQIIDAARSQDPTAYQTLLSDPNTLFNMTATEDALNNVAAMRLAQKGLHSLMPAIRAQNLGARYAFKQLLPMLNLMDPEDIANAKAYLEPLDEFIETHGDIPGTMEALHYSAEGLLEIMGPHLPAFQSYVNNKAQIENSTELGWAELGYKFKKMMQEDSQFRANHFLAVQQTGIRSELIQAQIQELSLNNAIRKLTAPAQHMLALATLQGKNIENETGMKALMDSVELDKYFTPEEKVRAHRLTQTLQIFTGLEALGGQTWFLNMIQDNPEQGAALLESISSLSQSAGKDLKTYFDRLEQDPEANETSKSLAEKYKEYGGDGMIAYLKSAMDLSGTLDSSANAFLEQIDQHTWSVGPDGSLVAPYNQNPKANPLSLEVVPRTLAHSLAASHPGRSLSDIKAELTTLRDKWKDSMYDTGPIDKILNDNSELQSFYDTYKNSSGNRQAKGAK